MRSERLDDLVALASGTPPGPFAEIGVYRGGSAWHLAKLCRSRGNSLHLFDTFKGIPSAETFDTHRVGDFADTSVMAVMLAIPDATFHVGEFPYTLPDCLDDLAFVHCDCDQYRSVCSVIDLLWPRLVPGGIMAFDDIDTIGGRKAIDQRFGVLVLRHGWACAIKP